jgi:hypothetical protein
MEGQVRMTWRGERARPACGRQVNRAPTAAGRLAERCSQVRQPRREFLRNAVGAASAFVLADGIASGAGKGKGNMPIMQQLLAVRRVTNGPRHHWFGYYDKWQYDATDRYLLGMEVPFIGRSPRPDDRIVVGMVDLEGACEWRAIVETRAWCWQQGTMLQWLGSAPDRLVIHNGRDGDHFVSVIGDVHSGESRTLPRAVYCVSHDGRQALGLNFARVARTRPGYGYVGVVDPWENDPHPAEDGIYSMDLETGENRLIISLAQAAELRHDESMDGAEHWFNHLLFSPDSSRFIFLHRWKPADRPSWRTRMLTARPDGSDIHIVCDDGMASHFIWRDPKHILVWARQKDIGDRYFLFTDQSDEREVIGEGVLTVDGHCTYSPDLRWILTDTYPDAEKKRTLLLYDPAEKQRVDIGRFYAPPELSGELRCDLHPRWNRAGTQVCIDSLHEGQRQMYALDASAVVKA